MLDKEQIYIPLRDRIIEMYHTHTPVKKDYEPKRIFNKLLNVLAIRRKKLGSKKGFISKDIISLAEIRYNNANWRDINKPKGMTRQDYALTVDGTTATNKGYYNRAIDQAKRVVRELEQYSEVHHYPSYPATDAHHIFMRSQYPDLADMPENIIALTGTEHYTFAHPNRNTQRTDENYQMVCLISKLDSIERAVVTCGGVDVKEINPRTMESKLVEGLYIVGELIDVDALTGGFNLQIAFSTGYCAGSAIAELN